MNVAVQESVYSSGSYGEASISDYLKLLKPGVMSLVVFTAIIGMWMSPFSQGIFIQIITVICIALGSGAGGAINMWYDHDIDSVMKRTKNRPVPMGIIGRSDALSLGVFLGIASVSLLGLATNWKAAGLLAFAIFFYSVIYTMLLKRSTPQNIVIGGAAGAFPPVIGWVSTGASLSFEPIFFFLIIFLWTPPHFWALALYRHSDYKFAGVPMLPVTHGLRETKRQMIFYSFILLITTLMPFIYGYSGVFYLIMAFALSGYFLYHSIVVYKSDDERKAMTMFGYSIIYLFLLFGCLMVDKVIAGLL